MKKLLLPLILSITLLAGCSQTSESTSTESYSASIFAMDTYMDLRVYGDEELLDKAEELIYSLEGKLSVTDENSEIYAINRNKTGSISDDTAELLQGALELCSRTNGALDISVYPVVHEWGFTTGDYKVPDSDTLNTLLENVDYTNVSLVDDTVTIGSSMEIDLGSVAKGYTSSRVIELFRENGVTSALLNLGGNVHALGSKPDGSPWRVAIADPLGDGNLCVLEISDKAVITSGGYERYFEEDGVTYWHIIDPFTGYPADSGLISVSIIGDNGLICDGLSTSLFVMGLENASQLWKESDDFEAVFVTSDGEIYITEGLSDIFTPLDNYENAEVTVISRG
jgi:thiamine biosynthesis lipoprotein